MAAGGRDVVGSLAKFISEFNSQLASNESGSLAQVWMPEAGEDGSIVLNTQALPYSINGVGDLLALFRCISCKYKFSTDITKTHAMGAVGRVFTSGEPEMSGHVQRYDQHVYLRAAEAQRCRVHSTLFMPIYGSRQRDACLAVFEVVLTDADVNFAGMVGWINSCLQSEGLFTAEVDTASILNRRMGLRSLGSTEYDGVSALETEVAARPLLPDGGRHLMVAEDCGSKRQPAMAAVAAGLDLLTVTATLPLGQQHARAEGKGAGAQTGTGDALGQQHARAEGKGVGAQTGTGDALGPAQSDEVPLAKRPRTEGGSSIGGREDCGDMPHLQRMTSGPEGMPSPTPQQLVATSNGSGSGQAQEQQQQQAAHVHAQRQVKHRLSGSLPLRKASSLPNVMNGSGHHSGSGGLPSGSTAQVGQLPVPTPQMPIVAATVQQLLSKSSPNPQLAALLGRQAMPQQLQASMGGPGSSGGITGSLMNGTGLMNGPLPAVTPSLLPRQQQQNGGAGEGGEEDEEETDDDKAFLRPVPGAAQKYGQGNRVLTYDDLAAQFGYGLKEAASRLNICSTTLKRACRRLGIPRWPRRELVKHKRQKQAPCIDTGGSQQQQLQQGGGGTQVGNGSLAKGPGFRSGSGPSSGGSGNPQVMLMAAAAAASHRMQQPASGSLLSGLQGLQGMEQQLPLHNGDAASGLSPGLAAAIANSLQTGLASPPANPSLVGQMIQLLLQHQQPPSLPPMHPQHQHQHQRRPDGMPGPMGPAGMPHGMQLHSPAGCMGPLQPSHLLARCSPFPPAPLLSNLGLPRRADSKLQSVGQGMGSLDILAAADLDVSVGNMSVGNSPCIALSNLGGPSQLGLSGFDFGGTAANGGGGGATGPQSDHAFSTGAMPPRPVDK